MYVDRGGSEFQFKSDSGERKKTLSIEPAADPDRKKDWNCYGNWCGLRMVNKCVANGETMAQDLPKER